ncbi:two-component sensor histidine kinase [Brachybacterium endophyticum]|uniref:histidine kinase n=1 Tax=Brachybacterium endophyticum TaxID=2182385 RepID=A0A2U2RL55_9MICO|nr:histidine kinase [Brachybacterium endophyticum]PWH06609.1 two-component sensor histidine kinase [Brachybacterium endophyticum]
MEQEAVPGRRAWVEIVLVIAVLAETAGRVAWNLTQRPGEDPLSIVIGLLAGLALLARHRWWRWLLPLVLVVDVLGASQVVLAVATFALTVRLRGRWQPIGVMALAVVAGVLPHLVDPSHPTLAGAIVSGLVAVVAGLMGMYARARSELLRELTGRAEEAEHRRATAEQDARRAERTRIAREMHDIVAHKISLVALQAGALEVNQNLEREEVSRSAGLIRETAADALSELREVLGVLRGEEEVAPLNPQPTWEDVRRLVDATKEAGVQVELFDFIDVRVPDALARTAYRVVQEGLTNIHKHARHTRARVALIGEPGDDLLIEISNVLPKGFTSDLPGARMGLSGIETRVTHAGGTFTSGPTDDGRFEVKAVIPWPNQQG